MDVEFELCEYLAVNGWFDPTIEQAADALVDQQEQLAFAEQFGRQEALKDVRPPASFSTQGQTTIPYILERLRDHRYISPYRD